MFLESDDIFAGNPKDSFFNIIFNANRNLVENEIENLIEKLALYELLLEKNEINYTDKVMLEIKYNNQEKVEAIKRDFFIDATSNIVSQNE
jgi:hypothetical protein